MVTRTAADLVVTGRRGLGPLVELLAGSVIPHLVPGAPGPVAAVPPAAPAERRVLEAAARA
jgi:nucleotide-binding universal stress UspA family protein